MQLTFDQIAAYTQATVSLAPSDPACQATSITWDSREVTPGACYVALPGERHDGHDFIASAVADGATVILASHRPDEAACAAVRAAGAALLEVPDTNAAFTDLARGWRGHLTGRVIALTGSVGKTTTKNLTRDVLSASFSVVATKANQNNELGVPRTLLAADADTEMVVVEMGMRGAGQLTGLCSFVRPDWGLVTNVGESHIELLGSRDNIARANGELLTALPADGIAFVHAADDYTPFLWREAAPAARRVSFDGSGSFDAAARTGAAVWAEDVDLDEGGHPTFTLCAAGFAGGEEERVACTLGLLGLHNVSNATSAAAVARAAGMPLPEIAAALGAATAESGRQDVRRAAGGWLVIDDAYNASPDSMHAALATFDALPVEGRRFAVLGDMGELGDFAREAHERVGSFVAASRTDALVCIGNLARHIAEGARAAGFAADAIVEFPERDEALAYLQDTIAPGDAVLVKASHSMELDALAKGLLN